MAQQIPGFDWNAEQEEIEQNLLNRESQQYTDHLLRALDDKTPNRYIQDMMGERTITSTTKRHFVDAREQSNKYLRNSLSQTKRGPEQSAEQHVPAAHALDKRLMKQNQARAAGLASGE